MKKLILLTALGITMLGAQSMYAQEAASKIQQVISSIPSLNKASAEIAKFESKVAGKKETYANASADLKALKEKYKNELIGQIAAHKSDKNVKAVLEAELERIKKEIQTIK